MVCPIVVLPSRLPQYSRSTTTDYLDFYRRFDERTGEMSYFYNFRWPHNNPPFEIMKDGKMFYFWKTEER